MKPERLQKIINEYDKRVDDRDTYEWDMFVSDVIPELIAAYENQGELLQLSLANVDRLNEGAEMQHEIHVMLIEDAVSKYETAQAELAEKQKLADDFMKLMHDHIDDGVQLRKQLAEAQAEVERGHFGIGHKP